MNAVALVYRAEVRRRWASWLLLSLLVALVSGAVLAGAAAGRATASAFPRFVAKYGYDAEVFSVKPLTNLESLPDVTAVVAQASYFNGTITHGNSPIPVSDDVSLGTVPTTGGPLVKLLSGRMPTSADEVLVSFVLEQQYGLHIGSSLGVPFYRPSQVAAIVNSAGGVPTLGPTVRLRVVGIEASITDFPSGNLSYNMFVGPAFAKTYDSSVGSGYDTYVRLRHGAADLPLLQVQLRKLYSKAGLLYFQGIDPLDSAVEGSIHPQAVGWWLLALLAGLGGLIVIGQALTRQGLVEADTYPTLRAIGLRPAQLFRLGLARAVTIGVIGSLGGLALAWSVSSLTPVGEARVAEPTQGFVFDPLVLLVGACVTVLVTVALGALPAWRFARPSTGEGTSAATRATSSGSAAWLRRAGSAPSFLVGIRRALDRGTGRSTVPVVTAILGATVAVTALVATTVFGASLTHLTRTPRLYGHDWQVLISGNATGSQVHSIIAQVEKYPAVSQISYGLPGKYLEVNGNPVQALIVGVALGAPALSTGSGMVPSSPGEIALGVTTLRQAHARLGSSVRVSILSKDGVTQSGNMRVVGTVAFPPDLGTGGLGVGAVVTLDGAAAFLCQSSSNQSECRAAALSNIDQQNGWGILVAVRPGAMGRATVAKLDRRYAEDIFPTSPPTDLVNFGEAVNFPLLLGIALALFGAAAFVHLLVVSVARRRRDVALLKALGFVRRQIVAAVCWQATTVAFLAVVIGVPIGIAVGRVVWHVFAFNLGAVPVAVVPGVLITVIAVAIVAGANVLALLPAVSAARLQPAKTLREA